jgi:hypothetical protein
MYFNLPNMSKHYVFLLFILIPWRLFSQGEANIWYFGEYAGLDFNSGSPVALTDGQLFSFEGCATQSDANGNLLFYTNGNIVWNRNHDTLSNGAGLNGEISSTQSAMILPKPGSPNKYYIFTTTQAQRANNWVFCYSEVDMSLDGGLGGITSLKNVQLFEPISEKITAVKHANNQDIWVITHDKFSNKYLTYAITNAGVNSTPLIFSGGTIDTGSGDGFPSPNWGYLKASPNGNTLASAIMLMNKIDILNFNKATGQISLRYTIDQETPYGVEFSPSGQLLYVTGLWVLSMKQYDLTLPTASAVVSNAYNFSSLNSTAPCALQLGPDEKIYVSSAGDTAVACIRNPDQQGVGCNFTPRHISLNGRMNYLGLPNFFQNYLTPSGIKHLGSCENDTTFFSLENSLPFDSIHWNFGDIGSGILNSSNDSSTFHIYQNPGDYLVQAIIFQNGQSRIINKPVSIFTIPNISLGPDTFFCNFEIINLNVAGFIDGYAYSTHPEIITNNFFDIEFLTGIPEGERWITVENGCGVSSDTILIAQKFPPLDFYLPEEGIICEGEVGNYCLTSYPSEGNYLWQDGSTEEVFCIEQAGIYYVQVSNECGVKSDTMVVSTYPKPTADLGSDTTICNTNPLMLYPQGNFDYFMWTYGSTDTPFFVNTSGQYTIYAYNAYCSVLDTIQVTVDSIVPQPFSLGIDQSLCEGNSLIFNIAQPNSYYLWQDYSTDSVYTAFQSEEIIGMVYNGCGSYSDTLLVDFTPLPSVSLGPDIKTCDGQPITLSAFTNVDNYLWHNGSSLSSINISHSGVFWVNTWNNCGSAIDTIVVHIGESSDATLVLNVCEPISINDIYYTQTGTYTQTLENASGCDSILTIEAEIQNFNAQIFQQDSTLYFNGNPTSIQWINCITGQIIPGATQTSFVPQITGNYGAIITIGECVDTSNCRLIPVPPIPKSPTNICENINVSPNPVSDQVSFTLDKESYSINLFTSTGALVWQKTGTPEKQKIDFRNYAPAMYVLQVDACRFKIVKQ